MGVRILQGDDTGDSQGAVMYCSATMRAFGPVFEDREHAQGFLDWYAGKTSGLGDARGLSLEHLEAAVDGWREAGMPVTTDD